MTFPKHLIQAHNTRYYKALVLNTDAHQPERLDLACHLFYLGNSYQDYVPRAYCIASVDQNSAIGFALLYHEPIPSAHNNAASQGLPEIIKSPTLPKLAGIETKKTRYKYVGTSLMAAMFHLATECGSEGIRLLAHDGWGFYEKLGFTDVTGRGDVFEATQTDGHLDDWVKRVKLKYRGSSISDKKGRRVYENEP